ncbi:hypothetical protein BJF84_03570 [Rhodococcus sp. CUA-806]|nr:hypothetical protein BJF84_03570 [Rhodococcus sp. CUA-806]
MVRRMQPRAVGVGNIDVQAMTRRFEVAIVDPRLDNPTASDHRRNAVARFVQSGVEPVEFGG